jgi:hypothetical protein
MHPFVANSNMPEKRKHIFYCNSKITITHGNDSKIPLDLLSSLFVQGRWSEADMNGVVSSRVSRGRVVDPREASLNFKRFHLNDQRSLYIGQGKRTLRPGLA